MTEPKKGKQKEPKQKDLSGKTKIVKRELDAKINKSELSALIKPMLLVTDEAVLSCTKTGMSFQMVDPAHVCMIFMEIPKKVFNTWKVKLPKTEKELDIAIDLNKLKQFLALADGSDQIKMNFSTEKNMVVMELGRITRSFALLDTEQYSRPKIPKLKLLTTIGIKNKELRKGLDAISNVADHVRIVVKDEEFVIKAEGDTDEVEMLLRKDELISLEGDDAMSLFPLDYFASFSRALPPSSELELNIGTDNPMRIEAEMYEGWTVTYLLAPRIEEMLEKEEKKEQA